MKSIVGKGMIRRAAKAFAAILMLASITAAFCGIREFALAARIQIVPAVLGCCIPAVVLFVIMAALWGRLYCEVVCPLGIVQDVLRWIARKKVRRVCSRLPETKRQIVVKWTIFVLALTVGIAGFSFMWLDPYGIFGRGITLTGGVFFAVLALAFFGKGRIWCNWICPVGTLLQMVSGFSVFKDKFDKCDHCEECRKCIGK